MKKKHLKPPAIAPLKSETGAFFLRLKPYPAQIRRMPSYFADRVDVGTELWQGDLDDPVSGRWLRVNQNLIELLCEKLVSSRTESEQRERVLQLIEDLESTNLFPEIEFPKLQDRN